jgi:hypothetical protein
MASRFSATDFLPDEDRPPIGGPSMKDNLGLRFHRGVYDLVQRVFDRKILTTATEDILSERGNMSDLAL